VASTASESTISSASVSAGSTATRKTSKSSTITDLPPVTPGELLLEEFLKPLGISQYRLATAIDVPQSRIQAIVKGKRAITADTDLRLARFFGLSQGYWLRAQAAHDIEVARRQLVAQLEAITPYQIQQR